MQLKKVKGHSRNRYNESADRLAKKGAREQKIITATCSWTKRSRIRARWRDITIDSPMREVVNKLTLANIDAE